MTSTNPLFTPATFNRFSTNHRIVLAPLTRLRSGKKTHIPSELMIEYYAQRSSTPGTLLISEGTIVDPRAGGYDNVPGIWSDAQVSAWRKVTDRVHANGSFIFNQIAGLGRTAQTLVLEEDGPFDYVSSSATPLSSSSFIPRELTKDEIKEYIELFVKAAEQSIKAGFDGVELHGANGHLIDQFIQDNVNRRSDEYGGSIENRSRFVLELVQAVSDRIGEDRVALRLSPWSTAEEMKMKNPIPQYTHIVSELANHHPNLAYIHAIESRVNDPVDGANEPSESLDFMRDVWRTTGRPFLSAGGFTPASALEHMSKPGYGNEMVVFGRLFIANPDLPKRIQKKIPLNPYDRSTFYLPESARGYTDYPFAEVQA